MKERGYIEKLWREENIMSCTIVNSIIIIFVNYLKSPTLNEVQLTLLMKHSKRLHPMVQ